MSNHPDFHHQPARPLGIVFLVAGVLGLGAVWYFNDRWFPLAVGTFVFGACILFGGISTVVGGAWRCRLEDGALHWSCPSRFHGDNGHCRIAEIREFQWLKDPASEVSEFRLLLADGSVRKIARDCVGETAGFRKLYETLRTENRALRFVVLWGDERRVE
ncbi:MAG: hypothetical protein SGJ19_05130 [Planctomycetia bacterium]|nr:hypothetical protein [Planctomycetia bacterium]